MTTHWTPAQLLEPGIGVILDTETTDLDGRIIEISIIDAATGCERVCYMARFLDRYMSSRRQGCGTPSTPDRRTSAVNRR